MVGVWVVGVGAGVQRVVRWPTQGITTIFVSLLNVVPRATPGTPASIYRLSHAADRPGPLRCVRDQRGDPAHRRLQGGEKDPVINKDPDSPIMGVAEDAVIGDLHQVVPAISAEIRRRPPLRLTSSGTLPAAARAACRLPKVGGAPGGREPSARRWRSPGGRPGRSTSGASRGPGGSRRSGRGRAGSMQPLRKTSPPSNQLTNTSSSGAGMSKCSPYISSSSSTKDSPRPSAIGCDGSTTHSRSRSPSSRHLRSQDVPISRLKIREKWPEWRTIRPMPSRTPRVDAVDDGVAHLVVGDVAPPGQDVGRGEHLVGQAVLGLIEGRRADLEAVALAQAGRDRARGSRPGRSARDRRVRCAPGGTRSRR